MGKNYWKEIYIDDLQSATSVDPQKGEVRQKTSTLSDYCALHQPIKKA